MRDKKHIHKSIARRFATKSTNTNIINKAKMGCEIVLEYSEMFNKLSYIRINNNNESIMEYCEKNYAYSKG